MTRITSVPRLRLIALLILALFSISAVAVASSSLVEPASAAKKKCKKGYKKNKKGKCKKKKAAAKPKVTEVRVQLAVSNKGQVKVNGQFKTDSPTSSTFTGEVAVTVAGTTEKVAESFATSHSATGQFSKMVKTNFADTDGGTLTVTIGGVTSSVETIK